MTDSFRFKRFTVKNTDSAMKVNSDGVLLGACVSINGEEKKILDAGTGTGTIALMIAQRAEEKSKTPPEIIGIDIDENSAKEARLNFDASPWAETLESRCQPLSECQGIFDLIVSNPPYYDESLQNPDFRKNRSRHTVSVQDESKADAPLSFRTLIVFAASHLSASGRLGVILPADRESDLLRQGKAYGLFAERIIRIRTLSDKKPVRIIAELCKRDVQTKIEELCIQEKGRYTEEYTVLVKDFYLWA